MASFDIPGLPRPAAGTPPGSHNHGPLKPSLAPPLPTSNMTSPPSSLRGSALSTSSSSQSLRGHLNHGFEAAYGRKLEVIEQIRGELQGEDIDAPGIIVIGSQSVGKSSILARLTGISFPTGEGTCTRSPAVVSVQTDPSVTSFHALVADNPTFDQPEECFSLRDLHAAIANFTIQLTNRVTNPISDTPIYIRHTRPRGPALTLIDLPGITHVAQGSADFDIHAVTAGLVRKYMRDENMIALVVVNANDDFGNSEALQIAKESDPTGARTIGVVSKCDLVPDTHSDILHKLRMTRPNDVKLQLGFYAVRNRSSVADGAGDGAVGDVDAEEDAFFKAHPILSQVAHDRRGMAALSQQVIKLQGRAVDRFFATARGRLYERTRELQAQLGDMEAVPETSAERRIILTDVLRAINDRVEGLLRTDDVRKRELNVPTRVYEFCQEYMGDVRAELPLLLGEEYTQKIRSNFEEASGLVLPDMTVDSLIHQVINELLLDSLLPSMTESLIEKVETLMGKVYDTVIADCTDSQRFPKLGNFLSSATKDVLAEASGKAKHVTGAVLQAEGTASFTLNPIYIEMTTDMRRLVLSMSGQRMVSGLGGDDSRKSAADAGFISAAAEMSNVYPTKQPPAGGGTGGSGGAQVSSTGTGAPDMPLLRVMPRILWQTGVAEEELGQFIQRYVDAEVRRKPNPELLRVQFSVHCYAHVVLQRVFDVVPMLVRNLVVHETHRRFHSEIERRLGGKDEELRLAMAEDVDEMERRAQLAARLGALKEVYEKVKQM